MEQGRVAHSPCKNTKITGACVVVISSLKLYIHVMTTHLDGHKLVRSDRTIVESNKNSNLCLHVDHC